MKITFILPSIGLSGGVKVVFEYSNHLQKRGHEVNIVYPIIPMTPYKKWYDLHNKASKILCTIRNLKPGNNLNWFDVKVNLIKVPSLIEKYIPDADIVVATWWETAYYVNKYSKKKGRKFYLIQHYEIWGGPKDKVEETYKLNLHNIVISTWLKGILGKLGAKVEDVILNGINFQEFYPEEIKKEDNKFRILMMYRREEWKGIKDGINVFKISKKKYQNLKLVMFGPKPRRNELPSDEVEFHLLPIKDEVRKLYNSSDIFLFTSHFEGFGLPPMEAMACKRPVVTTNVGAIPDYTIPGETALVLPPGDIEGLAKSVIELIEDSVKREKLAENGYNYIKQFTWDISTERLERNFKKYL